jgi:hypothetical protein
MRFSPRIGLVKKLSEYESIHSRENQSGETGRKHGALQTSFILPLQFHSLTV